MSRIHEAHALLDFQCSREPGTRLGSETRAAQNQASITIPQGDIASQVDESDSESESDEDGVDEDELQTEVGNLVDYVSSIE